MSLVRPARGAPAGVDVQVSGGRAEPKAERRRKVEAEAERLAALGATITRVIEGETVNHFGIAMTDPEVTSSTSTSSRCRVRGIRCGPGQNEDMRDWVRWHSAYDDPASSLSDRLRLVRGHLADSFSRAAPGPIALVSLCAGQGHDVTGALREHPRRDDVHAVLIEADPANVRLAEHRAAAAGLTQVEIRQADASRAASFADALPAGVLLLCGIFGNVSEADIERTVTAAAGFTAAGGTVIWTRHRRPPDLTPQIRAWFAAAGFEEVCFDAAGNTKQTGVGVHRLREAHPAPIPPGPLFTFTS